VHIRPDFISPTFDPSIHIPLTSFMCILSAATPEIIFLNAISVTINIGTAVFSSIGHKIKRVLFMNIVIAPI
jgi:hypothetical protein